MGASATASATESAITAVELRALLDGALAELDRDERARALLLASDLRLRLDVSDLGLSVHVAAADDESGGRNLRWSFGESPGWTPKLRLRMDAQTAIAYLQGKESLAIAITRGRIRCDGESRVALLYLPLMRLIVEPFRSRLRAGHPQLAL